MLQSGISYCIPPEREREIGRERERMCGGRLEKIMREVEERRKNR